MSSARSVVLQQMTCQVRLGIFMAPGSLTSPTQHIIALVKHLRSTCQKKVVFRAVVEQSSTWEGELLAFPSASGRGSGKTPSPEQASFGSVP